MAIYKSFWAVDTTSENSKALRARTIDLGSVESWEFFDDQNTRVYMQSGDKLLIRYPTEAFGDLVCAFTDGYGKLFTFNNN